MARPRNDRPPLSVDTRELASDADTDPVATFAETERFVERHVIGIGGMGAVIRAFDKDLERDVAIKMARHDWPADGPEMEWFLEEARINGQLEHPYIVPVYEFGRDRKGGRFLCMKLIEGEHLEHLIDRVGLRRLTPDLLGDLLAVFAKVCDVVSYAHSRGVVHRDIKPANVMVGTFGQVYLVDWGMARRAQSAPEEPGTLVGTPCYMAPEQLVGKNDAVDERTDIFGLGATLYEILTGQPPWSPKDVDRFLCGERRFEVKPPDQVVRTGIPAELSRIALKAMASDPAHRYRSVDDLKSDIERFQRGAWHLPQRRCLAGSIIIAEGEVGKEAFIIVEGRCAAFQKENGVEVVLREMGPGEVFGETAVFSNKPRTASVRALTDVSVIVVTNDTLSNALGLNFWVGSFVKALADRFRELDERLRRLKRTEGKRAPRRK